MRYVVSALIVLAVLINTPLLMRILTPATNETPYDELVHSFFHYGSTLAYDKQFKMFTDEFKEKQKGLETYTQKSMRMMKQLRLGTNGGRFEIHRIEVNRELEDEVELTIHATRGQYREPYLFLLKWADGGWKIDNMQMMKVVDFSKFIESVPVQMESQEMPVEEPEAVSEPAA